MDGHWRKEALHITINDETDGKTHLTFGKQNQVCVFVTHLSILYYTIHWRRHVNAFFFVISDGYWAGQLFFFVIYRLFCLDMGPLSVVFLFFVLDGHNKSFFGSFVSSPVIKLDYTIPPQFTQFNQQVCRVYGGRFFSVSNVMEGEKNLLTNAGFG